MLCVEVAPSTFQIVGISNCGYNEVYLTQLKIGKDDSIPPDTLLEKRTREGSLLASLVLVALRCFREVGLFVLEMRKSSVRLMWFSTSPTSNISQRLSPKSGIYGDSRARQERVVIELPFTQAGELHRHTLKKDTKKDTKILWIFLTNSFALRTPNFKTDWIHEFSYQDRNKNKTKAPDPNWMKTENQRTKIIAKQRTKAKTESKTTAEQPFLCLQEDTPNPNPRQQKTRLHKRRQDKAKQNKLDKGNTSLDKTNSTTQLNTNQHKT